MPARRRRVALAWGAAGGLLLVAALKFFVADVYPVTSESMAPTLFGGEQTASGARLDEWVLVLYDRSPPKRYQLVVVQDGDGSLVKRVAALPGERVQVADGDLLIEGERLGLAGRPEPILVFDDGRFDVAEFFQFDETVWSRDRDAWTVDARQVRSDSDGGMMFFRKRLRDDFIDPFGERVAGVVDVNDAVIELDARLPSPAPPRARLRLQLVEEGDTFLVHLEPREGELARVRLLRRNPLQPLAELHTCEVPFPLDEWQHLSFANIDNTLRLEIEGETVFEMTYEANVPLASHSGRQTIGPRVGFGAERTPAWFRRIRVLRDRYYTNHGEFGVTALLSLGPEEYFLLGDNSTPSEDSRQFGPVPSARIVGRPIAVVWPPSRIRRLER